MNCLLENSSFCLAFSYQFDDTALSAAVKTGNIEMCELLLNKEADVNHGDGVRTTM